MIEVRNISKVFKGKKVLDTFSMKVNLGEMVAITGDSGKGKSTLLNIVGLLDKPTSGDVIIDGNVNVKPNTIKSTKLLKDKIGYLFQNFALIDEDTVKYNLSIPLLGYDNKKSLIDSALSKVGLCGFENRRIYELSGGEQQRVALARVWLEKCDIILADEPTGSLDENNRDIILSLLQELHKEGKTIIIVTHDKFVSQSCDRVIELK